MRNFYLILAGISGLYLFVQLAAGLVGWLSLPMAAVGGVAAENPAHYGHGLRCARLCRVLTNITEIVKERISCRSI